MRLVSIQLDVLQHFLQRFSSYLRCGSRKNIHFSCTVLYSVVADYSVNFQHVNKTDSEAISSELFAKISVILEMQRTWYSCYTAIDYAVQNRDCYKAACRNM